MLVSRFGMLLLGFVAVVTAAAAPVHAEEPIRLRITHQFPASSPIARNLASFQAAVQARFGTRLTVEMFGGGKVYKEREIVGAIDKGYLEIGSVDVSRFADVVPAAEAFQLPFVFNFDAIVQASTAAGSPLRRSLETAVLQSTGIRILWWQPYGQVLMVSRDGPVAEPSAIAAATVRSFGPVITEFIERCGGVAKEVEDDRQTIAYGAGQVKVGMASIASIASRELWRSMTDITMTNHASSVFVVIVKESFWQSLPADIRDGLVAIGQDAEIGMRDELRAAEAEALAKVREHGMTMHALGEEQLERWRICSADVLAGYLDRSGPLGEEVMRAYGTLRTDPCCSTATTGP